MRLLKTFFFFLIASASIANADVIDKVSIQTAPLIGHPAGPFSIEFQFNDGSGLGDGNNTAVISSLNFFGGSQSGLASDVGGVSGDLGSSITMTDTSFFNQFTQSFTAGTSLTFQIALTTNLDSGGVPDEFSFSILDSSGVEIPTLGPANAFLIIDIDSSTPSTLVYASDTGENPNVGGPPINIGVPTVSAAATAVPEASSLFLACITLAAFCPFRFFRKRRAKTS